MFFSADKVYRKDLEIFPDLQEPNNPCAVFGWHPRKRRRINMAARDEVKRQKTILSIACLTKNRHEVWDRCENRICEML